MRIVVQRVALASVSVDGSIVGEIAGGILLLVGVELGDERHDLAWIARKIVEMRIFEDEQQKMNRAVRDCGGAVLAVSQFTLLADTRRGRRPSFARAAPPEIAEPVFDGLVSALRETGVDVATGVFGARMAVTLVNDGPVTMVLDLDPPPLEG
ncbi:D-tyrosyl-tRNA(Tyr) deacylase [Candidatus Bipolaricaulota bacterium]|nr:D-tyrosyl-tRNA(Tyr) deacylase [Candidatus Bipolaricaulota bacterium]